MTPISQKPKGTEPVGWEGDESPGGIVIPGSRIRRLRGEEMLVTGRGREGGKKGKGSKTKRERKRVQHPYCAELKGCCLSCLFLPFFNRGGTSSHFSIYISPEQHQLYFNINVT